MKKSGAPGKGDLVKIKQGLRHPDYTDWSRYADITYLVIDERGVEVLISSSEDSPVWIARRHLEILNPA